MPVDKALKTRALLLIETAEFGYGHRLEDDAVAEHYKALCYGGESLIRKALDAIQEADLQALADDAISEDRRLEYKRELHDTRNDTGKREFCDDFASFANGAGGDILFGVDEDAATHAAGSIPGVSAETAAADIRAMEQRLENGVAPRMRVYFRPVPLANGRCVIVARIPQSINAPHMTTIAGASRFCIRDGGGKHTMDVEELRDMFMRRATILDQIRGFVRGRIDMVEAGSEELPVQVPVPAKLVIHVVPLQSFASTERVDIRDISAAPSVMQASPFHDYGIVPRPSLDGLLYPAPPQAVDRVQHFYAQLFHNGVIEIVSGTALYTPERPPVFYPGSFETDVFTAANWAERVYRRAQFQPPAYVFVTLLGVRDYRMVADRQWAGRQGNALGRHRAALPEIVLDSFEANPPAIFKVVLDQIWNGFGFTRALTYAENGDYLGVWHNVLPAP